MKNGKITEIQMIFKVLSVVMANKVLLVKMDGKAREEIEAIQVCFMLLLHQYLLILMLIM
jgi:hypothetical protein